MILPCTNKVINDIIKPLHIAILIMKLKRIFSFIFIFVATFTIAKSVFAAGNIVPSVASNCSAGTNCSQFLDLDFNNDTIKDRINWSPTNGGATVTDTAITGLIWGETVGWINLNPPSATDPLPAVCNGKAHVVNTCSGELSGCAWGENAGWINSKPTNGGVTINTSTGEFSGYAWASSIGGWIQFACPSASTCVKTTWTPSPSCATPPTDVCPNIAGNQATVPSGYVLQGGICIIPDPTIYGGSVDVCTNIAGTQSSVPIGYTKNTAGMIPGICSQTPTVDVCSNLPGDQVTVPNGYRSLSDGTCVQDNPGNLDICPNINGNQNVIPAGYIINSNGDCVMPPLPYDACPNLPGNQPMGTICDNPPTSPTYICSDGLDNDIDGLVDYPNDPGCVSAVDNDEQNPIIPPGGNTDTNPTNPTNPGGPGSTGGTSPSIFHIESIGKIAAPIAGVISSIGLLSTIPGFATRIVNLIFSIPFYRRRRPYGIVYDSETKEPIDPAYVTVFNADTGAQLDTKITDINGRYGFLLPVGNYRMIAQKTHYVFPSVKLMNKQSDEVYDNLYFGDVFAVTDQNKNAIITLNMPMDRTETDWNQEEKKRMGLWDFFTRNSKLWERVSMTLFIFGFLFSIYALIVYPTLWNIIVFILYIVFTLFQLFGFGPIKIGTITDRMGRPVPHAVVRVWNAHLGTQIAQRVANENGQYYLLVSKGDYYITVDAKNASGGYDRLFTSETMKVHQGVINKSFQI